MMRRVVLSLRLSVKKVVAMDLMQQFLVHDVRALANVGRLLTQLPCVGNRAFQVGHDARNVTDLTVSTSHVW